MIAIEKTDTESRDGFMQEKFVAMLPIIVRCARVEFRNLAPEARQEAIQETIALAWTAFKRLADRGKLGVCYPTVLATYCVRQVRAGRQVGSRLNSCDVMSRYAQQRNRFAIERLDKCDAEDDSWREILIEDRKASPADVAATRIDFASRLRRLPRQPRKIALTLASGETTSFVAKKFGVSPARISQLRQWLRESWGAFQGEAKPDVRPQVAIA